MFVQYGCDSLCMSMTVSDRQLAHLVDVVAMVGGPRAHVVDRRRAISVALKPRDVVALSDTLSFTLCVTPRSHTLRPTVPVCVRCSVQPLSARPITVQCGLLWGVVMHPHLHSLRSVGLKNLLTHKPLIADRLT